MAAMAALLSSRSTREETEGGFTFRQRNRAPAPTPTGPEVIVPRRQSPGAKGGPGEMGRREQQRLEWRGRVDAAAAEFRRADGDDRAYIVWCYTQPYLAAPSSSLLESYDRARAARRALDAALAAPKPWRKVRAK